MEVVPVRFDNSLQSESTHSHQRILESEHQALPLPTKSRLDKYPIADSEGSPREDTLVH
jgi:hypothetical protein